MLKRRRSEPAGPAWRGPWLTDFGLAYANRQ